MTLANRPSGDIVQPKEGVSVSSRTAAAGLSIVRIAQDQSDKGTAGLFYQVDTGEEWATLEGTPLMIREGRTKWPSPFLGSGTSPECWSSNAVVAAPGALYAGRFCDDCEWLFNGCTPSFAVVWLLLPERREILLQLTGGMTQAVGALIQADAVRTKHVRLGTQKVRGKLGSWYTLRLDNDMPDLPPELAIDIEKYFRARYARQAAPPVARQELEEDLIVVAPSGVAVDRDTGEVLADSRPADQEYDPVDVVESPAAPDGPPSDIDDDFDDLPF